MFPVVAPTGTIASITDAETTVNVAEEVPKFIVVAVAKPLPLIVTTVPTGPVIGAIEETEVVGEQTVATPTISKV